MKIKNIFTLIAILFLIIIPILFIQNSGIGGNTCRADEILKADSTQSNKTTAALARERFGITPCVDENGFVTSMGRNGGIEIITDDVDPIEMAYLIFERNRDLFGLDNPRQELLLRDFSRAENGGADIVFHQSENSLEVEGAYYYIHFIAVSDSQRIRLQSMDGRLFPRAREINTIPSIDTSQAESIALSDIIHGGDTLAAIGAPTRLAISEFDGALHLVWKVNVVNGGYGGSAAYWIDAQNGAILKVRSAIRN